MYRNPSLPRLSPSEQRRQNLQSLWIFAAVSWLFALCVYLPLLQAWRVDNYLQTHPTRTAQALVTRVTEHTYRSCQITFEAAFVDAESGQRFPLQGPGKSGLVGTDIAWAPCGHPGPIHLGRRITEGDRVPVLYALDDPAVNRPGWTDYQWVMEQGWALRWLFLGLGLGLTTFALVYRNAAPTPTESPTL
jgi:hypothetical protein